MKFIPKDVLIFRHVCSFSNHGTCDHYFDFTKYNAKTHVIEGNLVCMDCMDIAEAMNTDCKYYLLTLPKKEWLEFIKGFKQELFYDTTNN